MEVQKIDVQMTKNISAKFGPQKISKIFKTGN